MCGCQSEHALSQWPSQANWSIETKIVCGCRNARQSVSGVDVLWSRLGSRSRVYFVSVSSRACVDKMAESKSRDWSSSTESQLKFPGCTYYRRRNDNHYRCQQCRLNEGLTLCTEDSPCEIYKDWLLEAWQAQAKSNEQKRRRKAAAVAKAAKKSQERETMDVSVEIHAPEEVLQLTPKRSSQGSSKSKRAKTATSSGSKATEMEQSAVRAFQVLWTQEILGFQRVCGGTAQRRRVRTPQITKWGSQKIARVRQTPGLPQTSCF